ncbi:MAG TPA: FecR domain-containing protein [Luteibacter sp.]|jgi:transmembrane sensor|uniref:FecR family protein n=1 Tax=Luteibacter sp. TaxID=1886636 RepID=UPI002F404303
MHDEIRQAAARRITEEAAQWLLANREGLDETSRAAFVEWLRHSPSHVGEYMAIVQWDQEMREAAGREPLDAAGLVALAGDEPAVVALHSRGEGVLRAPIARERAPARVVTGAMRGPGVARRWAGVAVAASVVLAAVAVWHRGDAPVEGIVYAAPVDGMRSLQLDDGSRIQLDRGSSIRVNLGATRRDIAVLGGTMLIDVGHDSSAPLNVTLGRTVLRDIGTVFQVSAKKDGGEVTVLSGRVDVLAPSEGWPWQPGTTRAPSVVARLQGGERATLASDGSLSHLAARTDLSQDLAWLPAEIDFHDAPVADVARRFNDYGQAPLLIEDASIAATRISGRFHARDPAGFVAYLQTLPGVQVHRDEAGVHIVRKSPATHTVRL